MIHVATSQSTRPFPAAEKRGHDALTDSEFGVPMRHEWQI